MPQEMHNPFKAAVRERKLIIGIWNSIASSTVTEVLAHAGFDWMLMDGEHSTADLSTLVPQMQSMKGSPTAVVIRPPWNDFVLIKRLLDCGCWNFLIPMVQTEAEARAAVEATLYPPKGIRGVSMMSRANDYGNIPGYHFYANDCIGVTTQIESPKTIDNLEAICRIEALDGVFVGPQDLACSLGHITNPNHEEVQKAIKHCAEVAKAYGKGAGILTPNIEDAKRYIEWGYTFVAVGVDMGILKNGAINLVNQFK
jgi:2-dehydro-3-deoxyglucarate aldolase